MARIHNPAHNLNKAYRLKTKPYLATCPACGKRHRVTDKGYIYCTQVSPTLLQMGVGVYRVFDK